MTLAAAIGYEPFGPVNALDHGNGVTTALAYDLDGRMSAIDADAGLNPVLDLDYGFDLAGNVTGIADAGGGNRGRAFTWDALHRLAYAREILPGGPTGRETGFTWDAVGNRTTRTADAAVTTYGYDAFSNRLETVTSPVTTRVRGYSESGATVSYANGAGKVLQTALYDATDRLVKAAATRGGTLGKYAHNALGQRVAKRVDGVTTHYLYDLAGQLIAEHDEATGAWRRFYVRLNGMLLGGAKQGHTGTGAIHVDHLGTPQKVTDDAGAVVWDAIYRPFGKTESIAGPLTFNLRFPGQYYDAETGLHYNYFRDYDPTLGRYIQSDPIGLQGGWNTYAYVGGNPVMRVDREGLLSYNKPPPATVPAPDLEPQARCIEKCLGVQLVITGAAETFGHNKGSAHYSGQALDFGHRSNPSIKNRRAAFMCCAKKCGFKFAQSEFDPDHYHIQTRKGKNGGSGELPTNACEPKQCQSVYWGFGSQARGYWG